MYAWENVGICDRNIVLHEFIQWIEEGLASRKGVKDQQDPASKSSTLLWEEERNKVKSLIGIMYAGFGTFMWKHHRIEFLGLCGAATS